MSDGFLTRTVTVNNPHGLHARPADLFSQLATKFEAEIHVRKNHERVDGKSVINIMTLGATQGTQLVIEARGTDAASALEALAELIENDFGNEELTDQEQTS